MSDLATPSPLYSPAAARPRGARRLGLASRLLVATISGVLVALALFYLTRLVTARESYLNDRLVAAETAVMVFAFDAPSAPSADLTHKVLDAIGAKRAAVSLRGKVITLAGPDESGSPDYVYDASDASFFTDLYSAVQTLVAPPHSKLLVVGTGRRLDARIELVIDQAPLIDFLWRVSRAYFNLSIILTAALSFALWAGLWELVIRPVQRLTSSIIAFGANPQDARRIISPSGRDDEIGRAEAALAAMQSSLAHEITQRKRLAELGLTVARINHDLRNMLSAAQLISDRLTTIDDPLAQRLAPRLVATLDRAIEFCQSTLAYGAAREPDPKRRRFDLAELVDQIVETEAATGAIGIQYVIDIRSPFEIYADPEHVRRTLENLSRNAAQALRTLGAREGRALAIRFAAERIGAAEALIEVVDTGPGIPLEHRAHIFEPFHNSSHIGGSGLGLAIAHDLINRNGGSIRLAAADAEDFFCGARFLIALPTEETE